MDSQYQLVRRVRQLLEEIDTSNGTLYNTTSILEVALTVGDTWARRTQYLEGIFPFSSVVKVPEYDLPRDYLETKWMDDHARGNYLRLEYIDYSRYLEVAQFTSTAIPYEFSLYRNRVILYPTPQNSAVETVLNGAVSLTDTNITVVVFTWLREEGWLQINNEIIQYDSLIGNTVRIRERSQFRTRTPNGNHADASAVKFLNMIMIYYRKPRLSGRADYEVGTISVPRASRTVTGAGTSWLANVFPGDYIGARTLDTDDDGPRKMYRIKSIDTDTIIQLYEPWGELPVPGATKYIISELLMGEAPHGAEYLRGIAYGTAAELLDGTRHQKLSDKYDKKFELSIRTAQADKDVRQEAVADFVGDEEEYGAEAFPW